MREHVTLIDGTSINSISSGKIFRNNTSGARGVSWHRRLCKWVARIDFKRKTYNLGCFDRLQDAAAARARAEEALFGDFLKWYNGRDK